ncbi:MAG: hypothetical protein QM737_22095 [Ferruginibacter sp.]
MKKLLSISLYILIFSFLFFSCNPGEENKKLYRKLNDQLEKSTKFIQVTTALYLRHLDSKTYDPHTAEKARVWFSRARQIRDVTKYSFDYIDHLKLSVKSNNDSTQTNKLKETIISFVSQISNIDSNMTRTFKLEITALLQSKDSIDLFSSNLHSSAAMCLLSKLQNDMSIVESHLIEYCDNNVGSSWDGYYSRIPLINQNLTHLKNNEELEVNVGLGYLSYPSTPRIHINGDSIKENETGFYNYKLKVSGKAGKYYLPVKIEYYDYTEKKIINKTIEYIIDE